jgi:uncharacterized membrane protein
MEKEGLLDVDNTVTVVKSASDKVDVKTLSDLSVGKGARIGAIAGGVLGLIFPPSILATAALGGAVGAMTAKLRETGFDHATIQEMAESMAPGTSMLVTLVAPAWEDEVEAALKDSAFKIAWVDIDPATLTGAQGEGATN